MISSENAAQWQVERLLGWVTALVLASAACSSGPDIRSSSGGVSSGSTGVGAVSSTGASGSAASSGGSTGSVPGPDAGADTWSNWASTHFFQPYCVSCHASGGQGDPSNSGLDFTGYSGVVANSGTIECGVASAQDPSWSCGSFPPPDQFPIGSGPKPSAAERARLVAWIDAGMPE